MSEIIDADHRGRLSRCYDVALTALAEGDVLTYEAALLRWKNIVAPYAPDVKLIRNSKNNSYPVTEAGLQAAIDNLDGATTRTGNVWLPPGTIDIATGITMKKQTRIHGAGIFGTILNATANCNLITIGNENVGGDFLLEDLHLDLNEVTGDGIACANAAYFGSLNHAEIRRVRINDVKAGQHGIWLYNPFYMTLDHLLIHGKGTCLRFTHDATPSAAHYGNLQVNNVDCVFRAANSVGLQIDAPVGNNRACNLSQFNKFQVYNDDRVTYTDCIGITIAGDIFVDFISPNVEGCKTAILLTAAKNCGFFNPYIWTNVNSTTGVRITGTAYSNYFSGGQISLGTTTCLPVNDDSTVDPRKNLFDGITLYPDGSVFGNSIVNKCAIWVAAGAFKPSENWGTSTGTGAQQTIAHGCGFTPTYDQVFLSERSTGLAIPYQSAAPNATNIYVTAVNAKTYNWRVAMKA